MDCPPCCPSEIGETDTPVTHTKLKAASYNSSAASFVSRRIISSAWRKKNPKDPKISWSDRCCWLCLGVLRVLFFVFFCGLFWLAFFGFGHRKSSISTYIS
ncbi:unnamed protein product [Durusdinium trenchii]|uniref:Uncharacterized protein n=1 Tax=Durusdinium trenchii TaxID=1381693 RepID=A0ABP0JIQ0_9DINO